MPRQVESPFYGRPEDLRRDVREDGTIKISVAGGSFRKTEFERLEEGMILHFEKEPDNRHDAYAIKLLMEDGSHVGYVANSPRTLANGATPAKYLHPRVDSDTTAIVVWINKEAFRATAIINATNEYMMKFLEHVVTDEDCETLDLEMTMSLLDLEPEVAE